LALVEIIVLVLALRLDQQILPQLIVRVDETASGAQTSLQELGLVPNQRFGAAEETADEETVSFSSGELVAAQREIIQARGSDIERERSGRLVDGDPEHGPNGDISEGGRSDANRRGREGEGGGGRCPVRVSPLPELFVFALRFIEVHCAETSRGDQRHHSPKKG
jgi:hypothetical protein